MQIRTLALGRLAAGSRIHIKAQRKMVQSRSNEAGQEIEDNISRLGYDFSRFLKPKTQGSYVSCVQSGSLVFTAGHLPFKEDGELVIGKVGGIKGFSTQETHEIAKYAVLNLVRTLHTHLEGDLGRIKRVVKISGFVNSQEPDYAEHPRILDGASELLQQIFGATKGAHARTAIGVSSLPQNVPLELEAVVEVSPAKP